MSEREGFEETHIVRFEQDMVGELDMAEKKVSGEKVWVIICYVRKAKAGLSFDFCWL